MTTELYLVSEFINYPHLKITADNRVYNAKTNKEKPITKNGGSIGIWVSSNKFIAWGKRDEHIRSIKRIESDCLAIKLANQISDILNKQ